MDTRRENDEMEIDIRELAGVVLARWIPIALVTLLLGVLAFAYAKFMVTPVYQSTTSIYVINQQNDGLNYSELQTGLQLTNDYMVVIRGRSVLEKVIYEKELDMSYEQLRGKIGVSSDEDTRIVNITVTDPDPFLARELADAVREAASDKIVDVMNCDSVKPLETANLPKVPAGPNVKKTTFLGMALGFILSVGLILLKYLLNDSIKTPDDVEKYLGLSTLGLIPLDEEKDEQHRRIQKMKRKAEKRRGRNRKTGKSNI